MSKKFLTRLAGGVALGSAALLLGTPAAAFASDGYGDSKDRDRGSVFCGNNKQSNEVFVGNFVVGNDIEDSDVDIDQDADVDATNENQQGGGPRTNVCIGDVDLELELED
ncbi:MULTISPECIES: hypothetical protein [unclassified Micromonospora]|uniref:hypothetical protein n=1 Tax=unclassified Micromonospora TaxID=2617518 RepID=UPI002FEEBF5E